MRLIVFLALVTCSVAVESLDRRKRFSITAEDIYPEKLEKAETEETPAVAPQFPKNRRTRQFRGRIQLTKPQVTAAFGIPSAGLPAPSLNLPQFTQGAVNQFNSLAQATAQATASGTDDLTSHAVASAVTAGDAFFDKVAEGVDTVEQLLTKEFNSFKDQFKKVYSSVEEELYRKEIFIENKKKILQLNELYGLGKLPFAVKINRYADLLNHEFNKILNGFNRKNYTGKSFTSSELKHSANGSSYIPSANIALPKSIDWRELGAVTAVKSQELCGACYAFSAAGALEGQIFRKTGILRDLSIQNLIDCTRKYGNTGCVGGLMDPAFEYVKDNAGIEAEATYPFEGKDTEPCRYKVEGYAAHDTGYIDLDEGDEKGLEIAVATIGPVSAAIDASLDSFQFYSDGVYYDAKCQNSADKMNHAVLVVGYGEEPDGKQYWIIKNSYGADWGNGGYMKLSKFVNNHCGIATYASYPLV